MKHAQKPPGAQFDASFCLDLMTKLMNYHLSPVTVPRWRFSQVGLVSAIFLALYCLSFLGVWIQWQQLEEESLGHLKPPLTSLRVASGHHRQDSPGARRAYPRRPWKNHEFRCLGWVATDDDGDETGERRECWQRVVAGDDGYCEIMNTSSGEVFRVMHTTSLSLKDDARFTCQLARTFTSFRYHAVAYQHDPPMVVHLRSDQWKQGIVMTVYDNVLPSAFASIRWLRDTGCTLPIELWFRHDELTPENPVLVTLIESFGPIYPRQIFDERIEGFYVKVHALYYSRFTSVLLLDADNFAVRDPTPLFSSTPMWRFGAIFWPDFWRPGNSIFNLHAQSLLWELLDLSYVDMAEQESGQVLVNRAMSQPMLEQLMYYATHKPNLITKLKLVWGDKDLFRLAWLQMKRPFHYNDRRVPGTLGIVNHKRQRYCGMTMVQYDLDGRDFCFWHRNTIKLNGRPGGDQHIWGVLQELPPAVHDGNEAAALPKVQSFNGEKLFNEPSCFGVKRYQMDSRVQMTAVSRLDRSLGALEDTLIEYANEAYQLLHPELQETRITPDTPLRDG